MNEIINAIMTRRSIRKFKDDEVPEELVKTIVNAGLYAANGRGYQSTKIIAITNKELRDRISEENRKIGGWQEGFDPFYGAPVILLVIADRQYPTYLYDGSLVMGELMLAAHSLGLGSCWIHRAKEEMNGDIGRELLQKLGIEGDFEGIGHCALGYYENAPEAAERHPGRSYFIR